MGNKTLNNGRQKNVVVFESLRVLRRPTTLLFPYLPWSHTQNRCTVLHAGIMQWNPNFSNHLGKQIGWKNRG